MYLRINYIVFIRVISFRRKRLLHDPNDRVKRKVFFKHTASRALGISRYLLDGFFKCLAKRVQLFPKPPSSNLELAKYTSEVT